jgi:hypothetical protein
VIPRGAATGYVQAASGLTFHDLQWQAEDVAPYGVGWYMKSGHARDLSPDLSRRLVDHAVGYRAVACPGVRLLNVVFDIIGYVADADMLNIDVSDDLGRALLPLRPWPSAHPQVWWPPVTSLDVIGGLPGLTASEIASVPLMSGATVRETVTLAGRAERARAARAFVAGVLGPAARAEMTPCCWSPNGELVGSF